LATCIRCFLGYAAPVNSYYCVFYVHRHTHAHTLTYIYMYKSYWINVSIVPELVLYLISTDECLFLCHCPELLLVTLYIHADTAKGTGLYRDG